MDWTYILAFMGIHPVLTCILAYMAMVAIIGFGFGIGGFGRCKCSTHSEQKAGEKE